MAYISPNSNIWILKGVPLDAKHTKSYRPKSKAEQFEVFTAFTAYTLTNQSYIRHSNNSIRVELQADSVINCNYMLFQNNSFGDKIFYAFITDVEYISNSTCRIEYKIDVLQTYYFDIDFLPSWIDREHSKTDGIGDSITADYYIGKNIVYNEIQSIIPQGDSFTHTVLMIITTKQFDQPTVAAQRYYYVSVDTPQGYVMQCDITLIDFLSYPDRINDIDSDINNYINNNGDGVNGVMDMLIIPKWLVSSAVWDNDKPYISYHQKPRAVYGVANAPNTSANDTIDGYTPVNKKLYTFPYNYANLMTPSGDSRQIVYEKWGKTANVSKFEFAGSFISGVPNIQIYPLDYMGNADNFEYAINMSTYMTPQIYTDGFTNWLSANRPSILADTLNTAVSAITNIAAGNATGILSSMQNVVSGVGDIATLAQKQVAVTQPQQALSAWAYSRVYPYLARMSIDADSARQVDDYFTKYGYSVGRLKIPNFWSGAGRTNYNYCKTSEANIRSINPRTTGLPTDALSEICDIFNNGVCLWESLGSVGNYGENPVRE